MARLLDSFHIPEVKHKIRPEEREKLKHIFVRDRSEVPTVPPDRRATGEAAQDADKLFFARAQANAAAILASRIESQFHSLGHGR